MVTVISRPTGSGPTEVAVVAGRKVGNAVQRNRAKRRLREAVRRTPLRPGTAYVFIASPAVVEAPFDRLVDDVRRVVTGEGDER